MQIVYRHGFNNNLMIIRDSNIVINDYITNSIASKGSVVPLKS